MRNLLLGAIAPAMLVAAGPADARSTRVDIPVQIDPKGTHPAGPALPCG